jgi:RNA polymerase sigma factor (sigma-70 family)
MAGLNDTAETTDDADAVNFCLRRLMNGESAAAQQLWDRYYVRLIALARKKLGDSPRGTMDENDVVQNAFTNFCLRAQAGGFPNLHDPEGLWALLALITARKAANQRLHQRRAKRGGGRVRTGAVAGVDESDEFAQIIAKEPSPEDATIFSAEFERFMDFLEEPSQRLILLWKLEERTNAEIARCLDCSLSAVERKLHLIRNLLQRELSNR